MFDRMYKTFLTLCKVLSIRWRHILTFIEKHIMSIASEKILSSPSSSVPSRPNSSDLDLAVFLAAQRHLKRHFETEFIWK